METLDITIPAELKKLYETKSAVVKVPHPILRQKAGEVTRFGPKLAQTAREMQRIMASHRGVGLAAPQVGIGKRLCVVYTPWDSTQIFVNPRITAYSADMVEAEEGCLSIPGLFGMVSRHVAVVVRYQDLKGQEQIKTLEGLSAVVAQHEIDHLDGILFTDRVNRDTLHWQLP
jgi:peptide deformylase